VVDWAVHGAGRRPTRVALRVLEATANYLSLLRAIMHGDYDVVHVQWVPLGEKQSLMMAILRRACDLSGCLLVFTSHNALPHDSHGVNMRLIGANLDLAHLVIVHSENVHRQLEARMQVRPPVAVVPCPLFSGEGLPARDKARERLGLGKGPLVLFFGLIRPYKGVDLLGEAWPEVRVGAPDAQLLVVGRAIGTDAERQVKRIARQPSVNVIDRYVTSGEMLDFLAAADITVFPYQEISQSGALMTAVSCGRPVVITPIAGLIEQVAGLRSSIIAAEVSGPALAKALRQALERRDQLTIQAEEDRRRIEESSNGWRFAASALADQYRAGLARGNAPPSSQPRSSLPS
jgi:glycosyltransferase involved in cell wall biosynthesis